MPPIPCNLSFAFIAIFGSPLGKNGKNIYQSIRPRLLTYVKSAAKHSSGNTR